MVPLHKAHTFPGMKGDGGGVNVAFNMGGLGSGFADLPPELQGRLVGQAYARQVRASGSLRNLHRRQARGL